MKDGEAFSPVIHPSGSSEETVVDFFLRYLDAEGARVVFGIPGGLLQPFFEAVDFDPRFKLIVTRHEEGAAFMADGYARTSHRMAVCAATAGPGATNMLTGIACAYADSVPLLVITGCPVRAEDSDDSNTEEMYRHITKYSSTIPSPSAVPSQLRRALRAALTGKPGPVHLNIPVSFWDKVVSEDSFSPKTYRPETRMFDRSAVQRATSALLGARQPVFLVGSGVEISGAEFNLQSLAELIPAMVATSPRAKGVFPEDHPLSLGVFGFAGHKIAREMILDPGVDVLMTIGTSLKERDAIESHTGISRPSCLIQLDVDPDTVGRQCPVDIPLVGDATAILTEIVYHTHRYIRDGASHRSKWSLKQPAPIWTERCIRPDLIYSDMVPVTPQRWRSDLQEVLPGDAVVFSDIGSHMLFNIHYLCIRQGQKFILNSGFGSMGHGTASPVGASLADPQRPVFAIVGDGCFTMNGMELITAAQYDVPVVWIVENNNMHGITWHGSKQAGKRLPMDSVRYRKNLDIAGIASAMGLLSFVVEKPGEMQRVVPEALAAPGPSLIEVRINGEIPPQLGEKDKSIAGFEGA